MKGLAIALVAALLLAGCTSGKDNDDDGATGTETSTRTGTTGTSTSTRTSTGTSTGPGSGTIQVDLTRSTPDGAVPLVVNLTLQASFTKDGKPAATPSGLTWTLKVFEGNSTTANATLGSSGTTLPANVTVTLTAAGNHTLRADVQAPGFAAASDTVLVLASAASSGAPLFFDGAEGDASQWEITETIYLVDNIAEAAPSREVGDDHPTGEPWAPSDANQRTGAKAWHPSYPDAFRTRMVSVAIEVPAGGADLTYWVKGGAEIATADVEGLFVLVGPEGEDREVVQHQQGNFADWTSFTVPLEAGMVQVEFRFDTDASCSDESDAPPGFGCGEGADGGGYWVDDITVA